jgi:curved DNA-binding protein CbpA
MSNAKNTSYLLLYPFDIIRQAVDAPPPFLIDQMTPQSELELYGNLLTHPFAELVAEITQARLSGSLRLSDKEKKSVVYFKTGRIVFAVSNARSSRLFDIMLRRGTLTKDEITKIPNFHSDFELVAHLVNNEMMTKGESDRLFVEQVEGIIYDMLMWRDGQWTFTALARIRDGVSFNIEARKLLVDYGRCMPADVVLTSFRTLDERFSRSVLPEVGVGLMPDEAFVLSRANEGALTAHDLISISGMSESDALKSIYTLWLGGLLVRNQWQAAFTGQSIALMRNAKLELKREARVIAIPEPEIEPVIPSVEEAAKEPEATIPIEEYLKRVEEAQTYYDILGVDARAEIPELKRAYFSLAKVFHPDRYHAQGGETLRRIQNAFTELAQAHETLKNPETREVYDYRMRKELEDREKREAAGNTGSHSLRMDQAAEHFDRGLGLLMNGDAEAAVPHLTRAVHYAPDNARYHAFYGKALSADESLRHKAEAALQKAIKLDPNDPTLRLLLAEFFIQFKLMKRAEGELTRLLALFPTERKAADLLEKLQNKTIG